ncbi:probable E3 SUMO-protein ligase RNF212 [Aethina tumida]|uniref:probable E3 SUMO-protein ligase RNF212 n=1 Tax=Aethina tumida TaxID=116153 RepID=UPI0021475023|nr:probable E3 SUMO-protein ligase RNF212 [Aethina tumida]
MDWVHCNKCSIKYISNIKFMLTECGHIFCETCIKQIKQEKTCTICKKSCKNFMPLSKEMDTNFQQFFLPFDQVMKRTLEVYNFQHLQKNRLLQNMCAKYNMAKKENVKLHQIIKKLHTENETLRSVANYRGNNRVPYMTSTPMSMQTQSSLMNPDGTYLSSGQRRRNGGPIRTPWSGQFNRASETDGRMYPSPQMDQWLFGLQFAW